MKHIYMLGLMVFMGSSVSLSATGKDSVVGKTVIAAGIGGGIAICGQIGYGALMPVIEHVVKSWCKDKQVKNATLVSKIVFCLIGGWGLNKLRMHFVDMVNREYELNDEITALIKDKVGVARTQSSTLVNDVSAIVAVLSCLAWNSESFSAMIKGALVSAPSRSNGGSRSTGAGNANNGGGRATGSSHNGNGQYAG